ncbi:MAG: hypothetical protein AAF403_00605, partial [Pseudomonadota bacterium]
MLGELLAGGLLGLNALSGITGFLGAREQGKALKQQQARQSELDAMRLSDLERQKLAQTSNLTANLAAQGIATDSGTPLVLYDQGNLNFA